MKKFPVNRECPVTGQQAHEIVGYVSASQVIRGNETYRENSADILGIDSDDLFPIVRSRDSDCYYAGWNPPDEFLKKVYEEAIDHTKTITGSIGYRAMNCRFSASVCDSLDRFYREVQRPLRLLDFGSGYGVLIRLLSCRELECFGYEPSLARRDAEKDEAIRVFSELEDVIENGPYDIFTCTEVLEHLRNPLEALRAMKSAAKPGAILAVTVPNCKADWLTRVIQDCEKTKAPTPRVINPWEHLNYFGYSTLKQLLAAAGFKVVCDIGLFSGEGFLPSTHTTDRVKNYVGTTRRLWQSVNGHSTQLVCRAD